ncbi:DUF6646 family protein [Ulvibacter litoralis]|uniref:Outer membrane protein beta-barrel domain-containing protein n=1 Tax=Ulvibacter litoralis TaxID=227084 RepID=A0A1G7CV03_9FLAO|nr:DUF6646 family protein [Ulvibacter litoralis]GHC45966.1 OmpA family outer membrane protein [Ulvibacter litoralis]SDE43061.1 hypothetical protein SAMN05421855_101582 [Ulvibacter litoralis]
MKGFVLIFIMLFVSGLHAQAFHGKGDVKFQVGANLQQDGTGIMASLDYGLGENISVGVASVYLLGVEKVRNLQGEEIVVAEFGDRFDVQARFNANLGSVINVDDHLDVYPGLHLGIKNFGGHLGARYFFSTGFGLFSEINIPFASYKTGVLTPSEELNNQLSVNVGATFNL